MRSDKERGVPPSSSRPALQSLSVSSGQEGCFSARAMAFAPASGKDRRGRRSVVLAAVLAEN